MSSFYGGKQGRTYNIVKRYDSVRQMVQAFADGGAYTEVNYGQYVLIDTILNNNHKSDLENGLLFRRGFDYNDPYTTIYVPKKDDKDSQGNYLYKDVNGNLDEEKWQSAWMTYVTHVGAGAIYVGQIVGPQGDSPQITPIDWNSIKDQAGVKKVIPVSNTKGNDSTLVKDNDGNNVWNGDTIKVASVTIRDNDRNITGAKIAFDIPKNILQTQIVNSNPYSTARIIEDDETTEHPFWYKWNFTIPSGKHGQDVNKFVKETGQDIGSGIDGQGNTIVSDDEYITYSIKNYDVGNDGDSDAAAARQTDHLGRWPYRVINNITLINKDRVIIDWVDNYEAQIGDLYRNNNYATDYYWVCVQAGTIHVNDVLNDITRNEETGELSYPLGFQDESKGGTWRVVTIPQTAPAHSLIVDYKAGEDDKFENYLRNLDYLAVDKKGDVYAFYSNQAQPYYLTNIGGLDAVALDDELGIVFTYKDQSQVSYPLKQIFSIDFYVNPPEKDSDGNPIYDQTAQQDSILKIRYKDGTQTQFEIKRIKQIVYNNDNITLPQHITVEYEGGESVQTTREPINLVTAVDRQGDNLIILYTDPGVRNTIPINKQVMKNWTDPVSGTEYSNLIWYNFGPLGAQYHVQGQYTLNDLKTTLIYGFDQIEGIEDRAGWLVTVMEIIQGQEGQEDKIIPHIYAFDYNNYKEDPNNPGTLLPPSHQLYDGTASYWYQIMSLNESAIDPKRTVQIAKIESDLEKRDTLQDGMLWFVSSVGHDNYQDNTKNINLGG